MLKFSAPEISFGSYIEQKMNFDPPQDVADLVFPDAEEREKDATELLHVNSCAVLFKAQRKFTKLLVGISSIQ